VRDTGWFKSSFSAAANEACVEVRITEAEVGVRDSKNVEGPAFAFPLASWRAFVANPTAPPR
jgi:hypothetical protein